jgi:hypothetical protein
MQSPNQVNMSEGAPLNGFCLPIPQDKRPFLLQKKVRRFFHRYHQTTLPRPEIVNTPSIGIHSLPAVSPAIDEKVTGFDLAIIEVFHDRLAIRTADFRLDHLNGVVDFAQNTVAVKKGELPLKN